MDLVKLAQDRINGLGLVFAKEHDFKALLVAIRHWLAALGIQRIFTTMFDVILVNQHRKKYRDQPNDNLRLFAHESPPIQRGVSAIAPAERAVVV